MNYMRVIPIELSQVYSAFSRILFVLIIQTVLNDCWDTLQEQMTALMASREEKDGVISPIVTYVL